MVFLADELKKEDFFRKLSSNFKYLDENHIEMVVRLYKFTESLSKAKEIHFQRWGLSEGRFMVLMSIWYKGEPIKATEIAQDLGVTRATMTGLVDSLIRDELLKKKDCALDRRVSYLDLSDKGKKLMQEILPEHFQCVKEFSETLSCEESKAFLDALDKLQRGLEKFLVNKKEEPAK
ncbi:MAG: MarR family winged helix-turn-helix transcriptional regulator [Bdellovibrionia bacterium]